MKFRLVLVVGFFMAGVATNALALTAADIFNKKLNACHAFMRRAAFEAAGGRLVVVKPIDLSRLPEGFFCPTCHGAGGFFTSVLEDGTVGVPGWQHMSVRDDSKPNGDFISRPDILSKRIMAMRFAPPQLAGKPVCVSLAFDWSMDNPTELVRGDWY